MTALQKDLLDTPLGHLEITWSLRGLHSAQIRTKIDPDDKRDKPNKTIRKAFDRYFNGNLKAIDELPIVLEGTDFQLSVWQQLRKIPAGKTLSYGQLAERIGHSGASRAVGSANGRNPIWVVVPCHRVITSNGELGGYAGGTEKKRWLLEHEDAEFTEA